MPGPSTRQVPITFTTSKSYVVSFDLEETGDATEEAIRADVFEALDMLGLIAAADWPKPGDPFHVQAMATRDSFKTMPLHFGHDTPTRRPLLVFLSNATLLGPAIPTDMPGSGTRPAARTEGYARARARAPWGAA